MEQLTSVGTEMSSGRSNTVLCIVSSACAGIGIGLFSCVLSSADQLRVRNGGAHTRCSRRLHLLGVAGSTIFGVASLLGLYFGSVTLATLVRAGSTLPSNAFFSQWFGLRPLVRDDVLGTCVTISGVVCFTIFQGSSASQHDAAEFLSLIFAPWSVAWLVLVGNLLVLSSCLLWRQDDLKAGTSQPGKAASPRLMTIAVTLICACSSALMDLATKGWSALLREGLKVACQSALFWLAVIGNIAFLLVLRTGMIYGCRRCDVLIFVPLNTTGNIFFSVMSGMVSMQEYQSVNSWVGLSFTTLTVLCGIIMLISGPAGGMTASNSTTEALPTPAASGVVASSGGTPASGPTPCSEAGSGESVHSGMQTDDIRERAIASDFAPHAVAITLLNRRHRQAATTRVESETILAKLRELHLGGAALVAPAFALVPAEPCPVEAAVGDGQS